MRESAWLIRKLDVGLIHYHNAPGLKESQHIGFRDWISGGIIGRAQDNHFCFRSQRFQDSLDIYFIVSCTRYLQHISATKCRHRSIKRERGRTTNNIIACREKDMPEEANYLHAAMT